MDVRRRKMSNKFSVELDNLKQVCEGVLFAIAGSDESETSDLLGMSITNDNATLSITDGEYFFRWTLPVFNSLFSENEVSKVTVYAKTFLKLIQKLTKTPVIISISDANLMVESNGTYKIPLVDVGSDLEALSCETVSDEFVVPSANLRSIYTYNSKELQKGKNFIRHPAQNMYYVDKNGAITFTSGACVNSFDFYNVRLLFTDKIVKLFRLFSDGDIKVVLGHSDIGGVNHLVVSFETDYAFLCSVVPEDNDLLNKVPVSAIMKRATDEYAYSAVVDKNALISSIERLQVFTSEREKINDFDVLRFKDGVLTILNKTGDNYEEISYDSENKNFEYEMKVFVTDFLITLKTCPSSHVSMNFGNGSAFVIKNNNITIVVPEYVI